MESTCSNTSLFKTINNGKNSSEYLGACSSSGCSSYCSCSCSSSSNRKNKGQNVSREMVCNQTTTALVAHPNAFFNERHQELRDLNLHHEDKQKLLRFVAADPQLHRTCDTQMFSRYECSCISKSLLDQHGVLMASQTVQYVMGIIHHHFKLCCRNMKMGKRELIFNLDTGAVSPKKPHNESHRKQADSFRLLYKGILENFELIRIIFFPVWENYKNPSSRSQPSFPRRRQSRASCSLGISAQPVQSQPFVLSGRLIGRCFERLKAIFQVQHLSEEYINAASILFHTEELCTVFLERDFEDGRHFFIAEMDRLRMEKRL